MSNKNEPEAPDKVTELEEAILKAEEAEARARLMYAIQKIFTREAYDNLEAYYENKNQA